MQRLVLSNLQLTVVVDIDQLTASHCANKHVNASNQSTKTLNKELLTSIKAIGARQEQWP